MSERINNKFTENNNHSDSIKPAFNAVGIGLKVSSYPAQGYEHIDFKFDHIVINRALTYAEFDYNLFEALNLIDITYVTDYPGGHIAFIDASKKLPDEFFYYLVNRARTLLKIVNLNYIKYDKIEDCAAYRDLMTTLIFIRKYSDKFNHYNNTTFILVKVKRYDVPGVYLDIVNVYDVLDIAAPKPISIYDNPRYKDYGKYESAKDTENKFAGAFVAEDPNVKLKEIKDLDISTLYPTKQNPMDFECWKHNLKLYINQFNVLIKNGMTLDEAWKSDIGVNLKCVIDCLLNLDRELIYKYNIDFAIVVGEDNQLKLGKSSDLESMKSDVKDEEDNDDDYLVSPGNLVRVGKEDDKRSISNDKIGEVYSHISLKDMIAVVENNKIPTDYIEYLKSMINVFNRQIGHGESIKKVWSDRKIGRLLRTFINNLTEAAGESDDYDINFSITVTDSCHLKLGRFADVEEDSSIFKTVFLSKPNDSISLCYEPDSSDEETDDKATEEIHEDDKDRDVVNEKIASKYEGCLLEIPDPDHTKWGDEFILSNWEHILVIYIGWFNHFIKSGFTIADAWDTVQGKTLRFVIDRLCSEDCNVVEYYVNFSITVRDDYQLELKTDNLDTDESLMKPADSTTVISTVHLRK